MFTLYTAARHTFATIFALALAPVVYLFGDRQPEGAWLACKSAGLDLFDGLNSLPE